MSLYATLGETELEIITWLDGLSVRYAADYAEQGLIGRKSLLQYTGHRPDEVKIDARLHASWCNPADEVRRIKERMDGREPLAFVLGTGEYRGVFVIAEAEVTATQTDGYGAAIAFELSITLREYVGDPAEPNPPGVITAGYRIPIGATGAGAFDLLADAPLASPGGLAAAVSQGIAAVAQGVQLAADVASLARMAEGSPASAALALPSLAGRVSAFGATIPVETFGEIGQMAGAVASVVTDALTVASGFAAARAQWDAAGAALGAGISALPGALYSVSAATSAMDGARGALSRLAASAATRLPVLMEA
ncbi:phage tail protein [Pelomicrobium methylotrophicum]|uniref:Phage tail protein n=1 Tax=Pelomicrobium methylotrophicum TaxID=2602750 RepID=A0A5C7EXC1_9PROT|nr:phage tail protein [Pelomicrobium methylotrophicum]TXF11934.1 phage tail protein [Pelomicrobium methylotrophicum]